MDAGALYPRIAIYANETCAFCQVARDYFDHLGLPYEVITLNECAVAATPAIEIAGQIVLGFNRKNIDQLLDRAFDEMACAVDT